MEGLKPVEKTIIDRCVRLVYRNYLADPRPENMPILQDLYDCLRAQDEKEAQFLATALEIYVTGSLNVFNHRTNVDIDNRVVCYDIKELGKQLKQLGMLLYKTKSGTGSLGNREAGKTTRYYVDEFHLLLRGELASWSVEIWKRFRVFAKRRKRRLPRTCATGVNNIRLSVAFRPVVCLAKHLAVGFIRRAALAPRGHMVCIHLGFIIDARCVRTVSDSA